MNPRWKRIKYKRTLLLIVLIGASMSLLAQSSKKGNGQSSKNITEKEYQSSEYEVPPAKIPLQVKKGFIKKYSSLKVDFWLLVEGNYQAQFEINGKVKTAEFSPKGQWLSCETIIEFQDIPIKCSEYIIKNYGGYELNIALIQETAEGTFYAIGIASDSDYQELIFTQDGEFIQYGDYVD